MDILQRIARQFFELFRTMTPSQRGTLIALPLFVIGGFAVLFWSNHSSSESALLYGKIFTTEESMAVEQALQKAQLTKWRRVGGQIMVPANEVTRYNAAIVELDAMPMDLGSQILKQLNSMGPFSTDKQRQEMKEAMLLQEIRRTLRSVSDIEDASIVVANSGRRSTWSQKARVTATVKIKPRGGRELPPKLIHSLQSAVARMVPDLSPGDVAIFDTVHGMTYAGDAANDPFNGKLMGQIQEFSQHYQKVIHSALNYIDNVGVTVQVDMEDVKSLVTKSQTFDPKKVTPIYTYEDKSTDSSKQRPPKGEAGARSNAPASLASASAMDRSHEKKSDIVNTVNSLSYEITETALQAAMPKAVQVSVNIPRDYYREVAAQRKAAGEQDTSKTDPVAIEAEVRAAVEKTVVKLIPAGSGANNGGNPMDRISVQSIDRVITNAPEPQIPVMERGLQLLREWGGTVGLALFAIWVLLTLRRMTPPAPATTTSPQLDSFDAKRLKIAAISSSEPVDESKPKEPTRRDLIQTVVKDNPEMTASVIGKWLQQATK